MTLKLFSAPRWILALWMRPGPGFQMRRAAGLLFISQCSLLMWLLLICRGLVHVVRPAHVLNLLFWRLFHRLLFLQMQEFVPHLRSRLPMSVMWLLFPLIKIKNPERAVRRGSIQICMKREFVFLSSVSEKQINVSFSWKECSFAATWLCTCRGFGDTQQLLS